MPRTGYPGGLGLGNNVADFISNGLTPMQTLRQSGAVVAAETVVIGGDTYRAADVSTDSTKNVANGELAATSYVNNPEADISMTAHGLVVNDLIRVQTEIMRVIHKYDANRIRVRRAQCNTSIATHADAQDIYTEAAPGGGGIPVGLQGTLTAAAFTDSLIWSVNNLGNERVKAYDIDTDTVVLALCDKPAKDGGAPVASTATLAVSETLTNGAFDAANITGGRNPDTEITVKVVPSAAEVTEGKIVKVFPFTPVVIETIVRTTATMAEIAWDGAATVTGNVLVLDNTGGTDWSAATTITCVIRPS